MTPSCIRCLYVFKASSKRAEQRSSPAQRTSRWLILGWSHQHPYLYILVFGTLRDLSGSPTRVLNCREQSVQDRGSATFHDTPSTIQGQRRDLMTSTGRHAPLSDIHCWSKAAAAVSRRSEDDRFNSNITARFCFNLFILCVSSATVWTTRSPQTVFLSTYFPHELL